MEKNELFEQIAEQFQILAENNEETTKASQARARKAAGEISLSDEVATREFEEPFRKRRGFLLGSSCLYE